MIYADFAHEHVVTVISARLNHLFLTFAWSVSSFSLIRTVVTKHVYVVNTKTFFEDFFELLAPFLLLFELHHLRLIKLLHTCRLIEMVIIQSDTLIKSLLLVSTVVILP